MSTTTAPGNRYRKTKAGTWVAYGPAADITAGAEITVTTRPGEAKIERVESTGRPFAVDGNQMVYGYLAARPTARPTTAPQSAHGGICAECGRAGHLTLCEDSSGISDYCCARCAAAPAVERSFC